MPVPARGPALDGLSMILSFDIDCGELVPGHRFIARGLSGPVAIPVDASANSITFPVLP